MTAHHFEKTIDKTVQLDYLLHTPEGYDAASAETLPLLFFLPSTTP